MNINEIKVEAQIIHLREVYGELIDWLFELVAEGKLTYDEGKNLYDSL